MVRPILAQPGAARQRICPRCRRAVVVAAAAAVGHLSSRPSPWILRVIVFLPTPSLSAASTARLSDRELAIEIARPW